MNQAAADAFVDGPRIGELRPARHGTLDQSLGERKSRLDPTGLGYAETRHGRQLTNSRHGHSVQIGKATEEAARRTHRIASRGARTDEQGEQFDI